MKRLAFLFSTTIVMLLVSCLIASPAWAATITIRAHGTSGKEQIRLSINGSTVKAWTVTTSFADYTTTTTFCGNCQVKYLNDGTDPTDSNNVQIDYIIVDGTTFQAEDQAVNTGVWQNNQCGGSYSQWMNCNGYIDFGNVVICRTLSVSPTSLSLAAEGGSTGTFDITSDTTWTVSSNQTWLTVDPNSGSNNGTVTVTAQANTSSSLRTATVTVSGTGVTSKTVTVTQAPVLSVSPTELTLGAAENSSSTFNITSSRSWTVSSDQTWLTVDPTSGSNNGTITVTAQQNNTGAVRTATVTVSATGVTPQTVTVAQSGSIDASYEIGTWSGFRTAAISYTFDDGNLQRFYTIALPLFDTYGFKLTSFPVTGWGPNWSTLQAAAANGHEIGSHCPNHENLDQSCSIITPYLVNSQNTINSYIPGNQCVTIAYPNCVVPIDKPCVAQYYIGGRGCNTNPESNTPADFYNIKAAMTGTTGVNTEAGFITNFNNVAATHGWQVYCTHGLEGDGGYSPTSIAALTGAIVYLDSHRDTFWVQTFGNVIKYIKERNSTSVSETSNTGDIITVLVTDTLDNTIYNYPITIRRPLPTGWTSAVVKQNGSLVNSSIVTVGSTQYIMFDVVPDGGNAVLTRTYGDFDANGIVNLNDLSSFFDVWLEIDCGATAGIDLNGDCTVNFYEFAVLANNWLQEPY